MALKGFNINMRKLIPILLFLFLICPIIAMGQKTLPDIDNQSLVTKLKNSESLISTGVADEVSYTPGDLPTSKAIYAFKGKSIFYKWLNLGNAGIRLFFDGQLQITIPKTETSAVVTHTEQIELDFEEEPLNWGPFFRHIPLSEHFMKYGIISIKKDALIINNKKVSCYVIESTYSANPNLKVRFWLSPKMDFACLQSEQEVNWNIDNKPTQSIIKKCPVYNKYSIGEKTVWFIRSGVSKVFPVAEPDRIVGESKIEVRNFQPNVDVSKLFDPGISPDQQIWDNTLERLRPFKELNWNP
jgi:hypothetical protein